MTGNSNGSDAYTSLFESLSDGLLVTDVRSGEVLDVNPACLELLGYARDALLGSKIDRIVAGDSAGTLARARDRRRVGDSDSIQCKCKLRRADGTSLPADLQLTTVTVDGTESGLYRVRDISEQEERTLRREWNLITTLFEAFPEPVVHVEFVDERPIVLAVNEAFSETFGFEEAAIVNENLNEAIVPGYEPDLGPIDDRERRRPVEKEVKRVTDEGERDFLFRSLPLHDQQDAERVESIGVYVDITERQETQRKLEEVNTRLQLALEATDTGVWEWNADTAEVVWDDASERLYGFEPGEFSNSCETFLDRVHPTDRPTVEAAMASASDGEETIDVDFRVQSIDGPLRWIRARGVSTGDDRARVLGIQTDVTDRKRHERELERERALNRGVQKALITSHRRSELERAIVEQLLQQGYGLAWIAERVEDRLEPRIASGDEGLLDRFDRSVSADGLQREPCLDASRSGEATFIQDVSALPDRAWSAAAEEAGFRSCAGIPLTYNDVAYGMLGVYHDRAGWFTENERRLLGDLADNVAFAVHSLETERALASDHTEEVSLTVNSDAYYLVSVARNGGFEACDRVRVRGTIQRGTASVLQYLTVEGGSNGAVRDALAEHPHVSDVSVVDPDEPSRFQVVVGESVPEAVLASRGATVHSTVIDPDGATITLEAPAKKAVRTIVEAIEDRFENVSVRSVGTTAAADAATWAEALTEKQATALKAAYHRGYFEQPRRSSATEVGESLGISHSTFLQHLRAAQRKTFERRFER
nr:PAS domain S-box protein [Halovivax cerinus]